MLPRIKFGCIVADPPWRFTNNATRASAENHYPTMSQAELAALPVGKLGAENAHLYLWTTDAHLEEALYLMKVWRFTYKQNLVWVKQNAKLQIGLGNYFRHAHERHFRKGSRVNPAIFTFRRVFDNDSFMFVVFDQHGWDVAEFFTEKEAKDRCNELNRLNVEIFHS
jgi:N6-adenosine-specific RNA methylase IME4